MAPVNRLVGSKYLCPRSCVGPEFVVRSSLPSKEIILGDDKRVGKKRVLVVLLSGQRLDVLCYPSISTVGHILQAVVSEEGLTDTFMLGLALLIEGDFVFLPPDTCLTKVAPPGWALSIHTNSELPTTFTLFVRVQLYLTSFRGIRWEAKHLLYLQLRRCLLERRLRCTTSEHVNLAGFALQAEFGDFLTKEHGDADYFLLEHYIPEELLIKGQETELQWQLKNQHESRQGLDPGRAEEDFITAAVNLADYGTHFFHAHQVTKDVGGGVKPVQLGIKDSGIFVLTVPQRVTENHQLIQQFKWPSIQKLCYNKQFFSLVCAGESGKPLKLKFKLEDKKSFYVFHLASLHHQFSLRMRTEVCNTQSLSREFGVVVSKAYTIDAEIEERWSLRSGRLRGSGHTQNSVSRQNSLSASSRQGSGKEERQNKENECPNLEDGHLKTRPMVRMGTRAIYSSSQWSSKETLACDRMTSNFDTAYSPLPEAYIINASLKSNDEEFHLSYRENFPNFDKLGNVSMTEERILRTIRLQRDTDDGSLGIQVTEGSDGAVYIQSVVPNGAAHRQGIIRRGDQVIAVGGHSLVNMKYREALQTLQQACTCENEDSSIELVLSQVFTEDVNLEKVIPSQVTARYRKSRASLFPQSAVRLDIVSTLQKPVEENYLKNIRYETEVESGEMMSKLIPKLASPSSRQYKVATPNKEYGQGGLRAVCCVKPATEDED